MKKYINLISLFSIIILLSNCDNNGTESESVHKLVGIWEQTETKMTVGTTVVSVLTDDDNNQTLIYSENNTFSYTGESDGEYDSGNGTWSTTEGKLTMMEDGDTTVLDYEITSGVLTMSLTDVTDGETMTIEIKYNKQ